MTRVCTIPNGLLKVGGRGWWCFERLADSAEPVEEFAEAALSSLLFLAG
jgi:hypothetical protein